MGLCVIFYCAAAFSQMVERLSLSDAIAIALKTNPQVLASFEQIYAEHGRFWRGVSPSAPSVGINYQYIPKGAAISRFGERAVEISQSIDFPTSIYLRGQQLSKNISIAEAEQRMTSIAITARVKTAYYDVLAKQKKILLTEENLSISEDFSRKAEIRYNVGEATNLEKLTAVVQRTQAQNAVYAAQNELKISFGELYNVLGRGNAAPMNTIVLTDSLVYQPVDHNIEQLTEIAFTANPQLAAASNKVSAASYGRSLAWSSMLPNLNASYYRQTVDGSSNFYGVSFGVSVPVWFLFDQRGQIQEASANANMAEYEMRSLTNSIRMEVSSAFYEVKNNERQIKLHQTDILPQAEEVYRTARASYDAGEINYIEFLQARQLLIASRNEYIDELSRYCASLAKLEAVVGTPIIQHY
jgi:outer membrane protein, heavy metal efflux system